MKSLEELIEQYVENEDTNKLNALYERLVIDGTEEEKQTLADGYISMFSQCHYDYMCGKFNKPEWILDLKNDLEKVRNLNPDFKSLYYFEAHVYEMMASVSESEEDKLQYRKLCIEFLRKEKAIDPDDVTLHTDLAENLLELYKQTNTYDPESLAEIKELLLTALDLQQQPQHTYTFYGFNGTGISHYLNTAYEILNMPFPNREEFHAELIQSFKTRVEEYAKSDRAVYYHWADTLFRLVGSADHPKGELHNAGEEQLEEIITQAGSVLENITDPGQFKPEEQLYTAIGHLFMKLARFHKTISNYNIAYNYYYQAFLLKKDTWTTPLYCSEALSGMALLHLQNDDIVTAKSNYDKGLEIFDAAHEGYTDFQLSLNHADFLMEYVQLFESSENEEILQKIRGLYEESCQEARNFYTQPYYGLAKLDLLIGDKNASLKTLKNCLEIFSNEYHIHDFKELFEEKEYEPVWKDLKEMVKQKRKETGIMD